LPSRPRDHRHEPDPLDATDEPDPLAYLKDVLIRMPTHNASEIDALLPHR
jgi:hypothetical protein